jgi:hypothetical protein
MTSSNKLSPLNWTYFNFSIIPNYIISLGIDYKTNKYEYLLKKKIISKELEIININIEPRQKGHLMNTLFDNMEMQDALMLKSYYQELVNLMIAIVVPYELDAIWRRKYIKNLLTPNSFIYFMNGMYFKSIAEKNGIETKRVYMHSKGIKIQGYTYSNYMFGNSSQLNFFTGHSYISGFYLVKNVSNNLSYLNIDVTPIALGTGSWEYQTKTPYMLRNKMS